MTAGCEAAIAAQNSVSICISTALTSQQEDSTYVALADATALRAKGQLYVKFSFSLDTVVCIYVYLASLHIFVIKIFCKSLPGNC